MTCWQPLREICVFEVGGTRVCVVRQDIHLFYRPPDIVVDRQLLCGDEMTIGTRVYRILFAFKISDLSNPPASETNSIAVSMPGRRILQPHPSTVGRDFYHQR